MSSIDDTLTPSQRRWNNVLSLIILIAVMSALGILIFLVYRYADKSGPNEAIITQATSKHDVRYEYLGDMPAFQFQSTMNKSHKPCQLFLMTDTVLDSIQGLKVRRRYVVVCSTGTTLTEYDVKIR